jgi:beta-glucosidase
MAHGTRYRGGAIVLALALVGMLVAVGTLVDARAAATAVTGNPRVDALLAQMTLDEKLTMVTGGPENWSTNEFQSGYHPGVPRVGIPPVRYTDGAPGIATKRLSTGMTANRGLAATFSREDAYDNGVVIGRDARALGQDVAIQPLIDIHRDPTWVRAFETYSEDPLLVGAMGAAALSGIQSQGTMAEANHFVGYAGGDDVVIPDQALHEIYVRPFEDAIDAGVSSIMCSYHKLGGTFACGHAAAQNGILRDQLGFEGYTIADWGGVHATDYINAGLDLEMPGVNTYIPAYFSPTLLKNAMSAGTVTEQRITEAVGRILVQYDRFGLLTEGSHHEITEQNIAGNAQVVQRTAEHAAVLLKNQGQALPLESADLASLAMIGPGAGQTIATGGLGERSTGRADRWIGTVDVLKQLAPTANVTYAVANDQTGTPVPASALSRSFGLPGLVRSTAWSWITQVDPTINFTVKGGNAFPAGSSHTWSGSITVPETGSYWINLGVLGGTGSLSIDGWPVLWSGDFFVLCCVRFGTVKAGDAGVLPTTDGLNNKRALVNLTAGRHTIYVTQEPDFSGNPVQIRLNWVTPAQQRADRAAAIAAARNATTAVVFAWAGGSLREQGNLSAPLPEGQDQLISDIADVNPNTIVVLNHIEPVAMPWLGKVKAVLDMWFPGDEGGTATARLLLGRTSPAGRLPVTWPAWLAQGVANDPAVPERNWPGVHPNGSPCFAWQVGWPWGSDCRTSYSEGIFVGYRWFDKQGLTPLFAFGHGLSYTTFEYSDLSTSRQPDGSLNVSLRITNTGGVTADEVPQVYLGPPANIPIGIQFAVKALAAFDRVTIAAGASQVVTLNVRPRELSYWSTANQRYQLATGPRQVMVGASSRDIRLQTSVNIAAGIGALGAPTVLRKQAR